MDCPQCGAIEPNDDAEECRGCGVLFGRWRSDEEKRMVRTMRAKHEPRPEQSTAASLKVLVIPMILVAGGLGAIVLFYKPKPATPAKLSPKMQQTADALQQLQHLQQLRDQLQSGQMPGMEGMGGDGVSGTIVPGKFWTVSGQVFDLTTLEPLGGGTVVFQSAGALRIPVGPAGEFSVRLPMLTAGGYYISAEPPLGYASGLHVAPAGGFGQMSYDQRLGLQSTPGFEQPLRSSRSGLEIGLFPARSNATESFSGNDGGGDYRDPVQDSNEDSDGD